MRARYKDPFEKQHGVKLGFMSFFVKACVEALKKFPAVNASVEGNDIVYHEYFDIGIAVSTDRGLIVPILRDADQLSFAEIEKSIANFASRARAGTITMEELTGGTFTITNGGVFGSLLSTPIVNSPQSAILGMHKIQDRAVVIDGQVVVRPMMYIALTYDHRLIDGREAVQFLVTVKQCLEDPGADGARPMSDDVRRGGDRRGSGRLSGGNSRRTEQAEGGLRGRMEEYRRQLCVRRHVLERRLHSLQGLARILRAVRAGEERSFRFTASSSATSSSISRRCKSGAASVVKTMTGGITALFKANGVVGIQGHGRLLPGNKVLVTGADGVEKTLEAKHVILASGSVPIRLERDAA